MTSEGKPATTPRAATATRSAVAARLLPKFLLHREEDVSAIRKALESGNFAEIARLGHNMRGNGRSYGFPEVSSIGEGLEAAANRRDARRVQELLESLVAWRAGLEQDPSVPADGR